MARRAGVLLSTAILSTLTLAACGTDGWAADRVPPPARGALADGFLPSSPPAPESTIVPAAGSWDGVRPAPGYRVVLLTAGDDQPTATLSEAVREWADEEGVDLRTVEADEDLIDGIVDAMDLNPDLIVSVGNDLVDPLATVSASHLAQPFLVLGAEIPEPTSNVTAVTWAGASFRGEGLVTSTPYDAESFTTARSADALRAGVAAVLHDLTGIVIWIS